MSQAERWQLGGNAPEVYETQLVPAIFEPWAPVLVAKAAPRAGEWALDVACGTGVVTRLAASQVGSTGRVVGLDLNPGMLARARAAPPSEGAPVDWREGNAGALPFDASTFDAVFCQLGFQYFPDRPQAACEMHRVLKPTGRLVTLVWRALAHSPGFAVLATALERHVSSAAAAVMRAPFVFGDSTDELRDLLTQAGFRTVRVGADVRMVRFASPAAFVRYQVAGSPLATHVAAVDDAAREALIREVTEAMQGYLNDDGLAFPIEGQVAIAKP
ncbi:MAG TPA: methyltransferase domain-containing protein [Solimonas sp.]|nr:methyltransferase domain-containing protein [Solimonas sp.]